MLRTSRDSAEILAERALEPDTVPRSDSIHAVTKRVPENPEQPRRSIYNGAAPVPSPSNTSTGAFVPLRNRKIAKRKVSPFNIIVTLMAFATVIVFYISNIIAVNQLVNDIHQKELKLQEILNEQEMLRAKINQMSSLERIRKLAEDEVGLRNPSTSASWLQIDPDRVSSIEEAAQER